MTLTTRIRSPFFCLLLLAAVLGAALALAAACGGADDDSNGGGSTATQPPSGPATITITSSGPITGQKGRILLVYAVVAGGDRAAQACITITSDSFTVPATVMVDVPAGQQNPCTGSPAQEVFAKGTYTITAAVFVGGQQTAEKQSTQTVEVAGTAPVQVRLDGASLSK